MKEIKMRAWCSKCSTEVFPKDFRTTEDMREFMMFGLCQDCQDKERLSQWTHLDEPPVDDLWFKRM